MSSLSVLCAGLHTCACVLVEARGWLRASFTSHWLPWSRVSHGSKTHQVGKVREPESFSLLPQYRDCKCVTMPDIHMYAYVCIQIFYMCRYPYTYVCTYIHLNGHEHIHTYKHIQVWMFSGSNSGLQHLPTCLSLQPSYLSTSMRKNH